MEQWDGQQPMHEIKAWVESDTEHPAPGELVAVATYTATYIEITGIVELPGPFLCLEHIIEPYQIWNRYVLLDQQGNKLMVNAGFYAGQAFANVMCHYKNRKRFLASDFLKSYIAKHLQQNTAFTTLW